MNIHSLEKVVIVGGGTSAWLSAALLSNKKPHYEIIVIDKEIGSPVGVGEGTLLGFGQIMERCGFKPEDWFFDIDATFKSGILFPGWGENGNDVWHPFMYPENAFFNVNTLDIWSNHQDYDFKNAGLSMYDVSINHNKIDTAVLGQGNYAYHIDCGKLVDIIQKKILAERNVTNIRSEVVDIHRNGTHISKLILKDGQEITADLFIDCTGFKHLLNESPERVSLEGRLFCDTAIAGHIPYADKEKEMNPYVISEAVDHGWIWNIPVQSRIGSGLVFNRTQTDVEEAKDYFVEYWDNRISKDNLKVIDWTPYYNKNAWHGNVVSIGLSGGFIEPLESTGVALIITGLEQLECRIGADYYSDHDVVLFNQIMSGFFEDSVDFVNMHYELVNKETKFWQWVRSSFTKSGRQQYFESALAKSNQFLPCKGQGYIFSGTNWFCWLIQLGHRVGKQSTLSIDQSMDLIKAHAATELNRHNTAIPHIEYIETLKTYYRGSKNDR
jgi:tryptophan halogenase